MRRTTRRRSNATPVPRRRRACGTRRPPHQAKRSRRSSPRTARSRCAPTTRTRSSIRCRVRAMAGRSNASASASAGPRARAALLTRAGEGSAALARGLLRPLPRRRGGRDVYVFPRTHLGRLDRSWDGQVQKMLIRINILVCLSSASSESRGLPHARRHRCASICQKHIAFDSAIDRRCRSAPYRVAAARQTTALPSSLPWLR